MRALSEATARRCENALEPRCVCRCQGAAHGKGRIGPDAPREEYEKLPQDDPHYLQPDLPARRKEEGNWRPAHWTSGKVARTILHVYKTAALAYCNIVGEYEGNKLIAQLRAEMAERKSVALLRKKGVRLIGDK